MEKKLHSYIENITNNQLTNSTISTNYNNLTTGPHTYSFYTFQQSFFILVRIKRWPSLYFWAMLSVALLFLFFESLAWFKASVCAVVIMYILLSLFSYLFCVISGKVVILFSSLKHGKFVLAKNIETFVGSFTFVEIIICSVFAIKI